MSDERVNEPTEEQQCLYAMWRLTKWMEGYGSYDRIDRDVASGKLKVVLDEKKGRRDERPV